MKLVTIISTLSSITSVLSVLFELKTHTLTHQDVGQLDMYVRMYDDLVKGAP